MKKDSRVRLFEVMGRLDKTFKPKLNEDFEELNNTENLPVETGDESPAEEQSVEEKYEELKNKVDELYSMIHGEESEEIPSEDSGESTEVEISERKKWNFEKKTDEDDSENEDDKDNVDKSKKDVTTNESKPKIPVVDIAKVGK